MFTKTIAAVVLLATSTQAILIPDLPFLWWMFCLHEDSMVMTPNGLVSVDQIKVGDTVASQLPGKELEFVEVVRNDPYEGDWEFTLFELADGSSTTATSNHLMAVEKSTGAEIEVAQDVRVGDKMYVHTTDDADGLKPVEVTKVETLNRPRKYNLVTKNAAVLVDDVLTTTICDEGISKLPLGLEDALKMWLAQHPEITEQLDGKELLERILRDSKAVYLDERPSKKSEKTEWKKDIGAVRKTLKALKEELN